MTALPRDFQPPLQYEDLRRLQLEEAIGTRIYGVPIESGGLAQAIQPHPDLIPVWGCVCVHDSPHAPCPCRWIVWLPRDRVLRSGKSSFRSARGDEIHWFLIRNDADVLVEKQEYVRVPAYAEMLGRWAARP